MLERPQKRLMLPGPGLRSITGTTNSEGCSEWQQIQLPRRIWKQEGVPILAGVEVTGELQSWSWHCRGTCCLVGAATRLLWTLIKITGKEREEDILWLLVSRLPSQCSLVKPQKNQFGRDLGNVVCISHLSLVCDIGLQSMGKETGGGEPE